MENESGGKFVRYRTRDRYQRLSDHDERAISEPQLWVQCPFHQVHIHQQQTQQRHQEVEVLPKQQNEKRLPQVDSDGPLRSADFSSIRRQAEAPSESCEAFPAVIVAEGSASKRTGTKPETSDNFVPGRLH
jgi:hypothetical protein